jgi:hypothetical protein
MKLKITTMGKSSINKDITKAAELIPAALTASFLRKEKNKYIYELYFIKSTRPFTSVNTERAIVGETSS